MIFITAIPTRELIAYKETHCYDYIIKPFLEEEISEKVSRIIKYYRNNQQNNVEEELKLGLKAILAYIRFFKKTLSI